MKLFDLSKTLERGLAVFPGDPEFDKRELASIEQDGYRLSRISMSSHAGTHIDAPAHYIPYGKKVKDLSLNKLVGPCFVAGHRAQALEALDLGFRRLILSFSPDDELVDVLIQAGIVLLGTGQLTIGSDEMHTRLLLRGIVIVENLELSAIVPGSYFLCALPLKLDAEGAPARVVLFDQLQE